ncbi:MAG: hypothetical protein D8M57_03535 [Candidatus Scalindua sp. AMX11]|nr:MAG: hypothetical protein DWQ00_11160 [Candidatus Scalindua sp.]TDE66187.1 MAG: hypothetical protein D8M57_03535 [Candidatus Scalindua sp. AMX11]
MFSVGCQTTTDPRRGGLFSYNPRAYEKRLDDRRSQKIALKRENTVMQQNSENLKEQFTNKQAEEDERARQIAVLDKEIDMIEGEIANSTLRTDLQKHAKWKIDLELKGMKKKLTDTGLKERELRELKDELARLMEEAEMLSDL